MREEVGRVLQPWVADHKVCPAWNGLFHVRRGLVITSQRGSWAWVIDRLGQLGNGPFWARRESQPVFGRGQPLGRTRQVWNIWRFKREESISVDRWFIQIFWQVWLGARREEENCFHFNCFHPLRDIVRILSIFPWRIEPKLRWFVSGLLRFRNLWHCYTSYFHVILAQSFARFPSSWGWTW